jgi:hypothetical protein
LGSAGDQNMVWMVTLFCSSPRVNGLLIQER